MQSLLVAATHKEIENLLNAFTFIEKQNANLSSYIYQSHKIDVLVTGIGIHSTAFYLGKYLSDKYRFAINVGIAGSFNSNIDLGSVVNVYSDCFAELGAENGEEFLSVFDLGLIDKNEFPFTNGVIENKWDLKNQAIENLPKVNGITVNKVHGNVDNIEKVFQLFHPYTESMEGAAFLYACRLENIPCLQIRSISNYVEKRNRNAWNIPLALQNLHKCILNIYDNF
ncbi:MAG: futalosine hydrolase [Bacteroidia bacterium]|nr:MAG: futalosine hydrolase [Bacteroidia bacterium]